MKKALLVELGGSHQECLHSQVLFLRDTFKVSVCCSPNLEDQLAAHQDLDKVISISIKNSFTASCKLYHLVRKEDYHLVVFNTAHGNIIRNYCILPTFSKRLHAGIIHNVERYQHSKSQRWINKRLKRVFVLSRYLLPKLKTADKKVSVGYFYPMFFPNHTPIHLDKQKGEIWIAVPGQVEQKRRDYHYLFSELQKMDVPKHLKFIFLGRAKGEHYNWLHQQVQSLKLEGQCVYWDQFVLDVEYKSYLEQCDYILPLIHADIPEHRTYLDSQISGTFNLAFGYHKPLLLETPLANLIDFKNQCIPYSKEQLSSVLFKLKPLDESNWYRQSPFTFEEQKENYLRLVDGN